MQTGLVCTQFFCGGTAILPFLRTEMHREIVLEPREIVLHWEISSNRTIVVLSMVGVYKIKLLAGWR